MRFRPTLLLAILAAAGCVGPQPNRGATAAATGPVYAASARIEPYVSPDQFLVVVEIVEVSLDGSGETLAMPRVVVAAGQEASMSLADEVDEPYLTVDVFVPESGDGAEALIEVAMPGATLESSTLRVPLPTSEGDGPRISCRFADEPVHDAILNIVARTGANMIVPPAVAGNVTLTVDDVHWRIALALVLEPLGYRIEEEQGGVLRVVEDAGTSPGDRVDLHFERVEIRDAFGVVARDCGANVVLSPEVTGTVTIDVEGVPHRLALEAVADAAGGSIAFEAGIARVVGAASDG